jgi:hypothetical protein
MRPYTPTLLQWTRLPHSEMAGGQVVDRVRPDERLHAGFGVAHVSLEAKDARRKLAGMEVEGHHLGAASGELPDQVAADETARSRDEGAARLVELVVPHAGRRATTETA